MRRSTTSEEIKELRERLALLEARLKSNEPSSPGNAKADLGLTAGSVEGTHSANREPDSAFCLQPVLDRLNRIEVDLQKLLSVVRTPRSDAQNGERTSYTTEEVAKILSKRPYTIREWCRLGRIVAERERSGRGGHGAWRISAEELKRYLNEGLLRAYSRSSSKTD